MTKDVLVSISGKHIDIMDDPARGYEVGEDGIEVVTPANYYCRNGKHYIIYDEVLEGMAGTIKNKIKITGEDSVEIMKSGLSSSHMIFERNRKILRIIELRMGRCWWVSTRETWRSVWKMTTLMCWWTTSWMSIMSRWRTVRSR